MSDEINVGLTTRSVFGKGASRRLRRDNLVPAIVYGDDKEPQAVQIKHNEVWKHLENPAFYSQLLTVSVDGEEPVRCILRDVQRHPYKQQVLHLDFMRVTAGAEMEFTVPIEFLNEDDCVGVRNEGGVIFHYLNEVTIACRPRDLPENITVDMHNVSVGDAVHLADLVMPEDVRLADLDPEDETTNHAVAAVQMPRVQVEEEEEGEETEAGDVPTVSDEEAGDGDD